MHILCISFKLYLYNFNSRIYIQLVPKVSCLVSHSTFFSNELQKVVTEIKKSSSFFFSFLFRSRRKNFPQKFSIFLKFQIFRVNGIEWNSPSNECVIFLFPSQFFADDAGSNSSTSEASIDFISPPCISPLMLGWNVIARLSTTKPRIEFQPWWSNKVDRARVCLSPLWRYSRFHNACPPINYRSCRHLFGNRSWK